MHGPDYSQLSFLVADDLPFIRHMVQTMLQRMQVSRIAHAANGEEALARLRESAEPVDCVISDWSMAPVGGLKLLQAIRSGQVEGTPPGTPFIMLTGYGDEPVVRAARALDVSGYLIKPVSFGKLARAVANAIARPIGPKDAAVYDRAAKVRVAGAAVDAAGTAGGPKAVLRPKQAQTAPATPCRADLPGLEVRLSDLEDLEPGTTLAQDVHSSDGMLLLARGQRLDAGIVALLRRIVDAEGKNDVRLRVTLAGR